ncbi:hypothetical protein EG328_003506 [Venturia inaequalis]|uniref:Heterokaryon incompatibility domain-containing protein n=1 Tax=Venturia inaequalis TaxID=5025 RepID=A0A8H3USM1_VENIN|nr:hypothetical protein EG328_003506 [Venturia inaequalis]KAE9989844.1 hypothetical protein EG327_002185 [Venturia inaequalis]
MTLVKQFADQCALCRMIHTEIRKATPSDSHVLSVFKVDDREGRIAGIWFYYGFERHSVAKLCCYADEGTYASRYLVHRHVSSSGSSTSISRIRKWLSDSFKPVLPTRVLSIRGYPESLHLFVTGGKREKYMALSHCWGGKPQYRTTKANLEENQRSIDSTRLSETIKNAIQIATSIDVPYLWVDSLCIIQEDEEDFIRESCMMASVYQQACCVIAATAAANGSMGLSQRTPSHSLTSLPCDPRKPEHGNMYLGPGDDQALERSLFRGPLNQRGWVLQERIFARRTIHFAGDQIYWECDKEFVGEDGGDMQGAADTETITRSLLCKIIDDFRGFRRNHNFPHQGRFDRNSDLHSLWAGLQYCDKVRFESIDLTAGSQAKLCYAAALLSSAFDSGTTLRKEKPPPASKVYR